MDGLTFRTAGLPQVCNWRRRDITYPISWDLFDFCQITAFWKGSGVSVRFHKNSFTVVETAIQLQLLLLLSLQCVYWSFYFANPLTTITLSFYWTLRPKARGALRWSGLLRQCPLTIFSYLDHLGITILQTSFYTYMGQYVAQSLTRTFSESPPLLMKNEITLCEQNSLRLSLSPEATRLEWKCQSQGWKVSLLACF